MKPVCGSAVLLVIGVLAAPLPAHADGFVSPTVGVNVGGQAGQGAGIRPYGLIGVGNFSENDFGFDIGAGVMGYSPTTSDCGSTIDFRNFQSTDTNVIGLASGHFNFNRASVGVLFRF
jgi:hypothetical protein